MAFIEPLFVEIATLVACTGVVLTLRAAWVYWSLWKTRRVLFPIELIDVPIPNEMTQDAHYQKIMEVSPKIPSCSEMIYLLKYKRFMLRDDVFSMCARKEVDQMEYLLRDIIKRKVPGVIVETGSWRCGMVAWCAALLDQLEPQSTRGVCAFDAFGEFPKATAGSAKDASIHPLVEFLFEKPWDFNRILTELRSRSLLSRRMTFAKGLFENTVPASDFDAIAILRLDGDYYDSTMLVLKHYYKRLSHGAWVVIDDYNNPFLGCRQAVDEFRSRNGITSPIIDTHGGSVYWRVP